MRTLIVESYSGMTRLLESRSPKGPIPVLHMRGMLSCEASMGEDADFRILFEGRLQTDLVIIQRLKVSAYQKHRRQGTHGRFLPTARLTILK